MYENLLYENLLIVNLLIGAAQSVEPGSNVGSALPEALRISGIALLAIFFVMGLFGSMIALLARLFPEQVDESE